MMRFRFWLALKLMGPLPITLMAKHIAHSLEAEAARVCANEPISLDHLYEAIVIGIETFWDLLNGEPG